MKQIDLTGFGVMGEEGTVLEPAQNPHTVSDHFARLLIASNRAVEHDAERPVRPASAPSVPPGVQKRDPKATNRDPR